MIVTALVTENIPMFSENLFYEFVVEHVRGLARRPVRRPMRSSIGKWMFLTKEPVELTPSHVIYY